MTRMRTFSPRQADIERGWRVIDAEGETLGRLATRIAGILRGKDKPTYTMHMSVGDNVIVINAEKIQVTGNKEGQKVYYRHTQYPGGLRAVNLAAMRDKHPDRIIQKAVKGMLPHNRLGRQTMRRLHVYTGSIHPHEAQVRAGQGAAGRRRQVEIEAQAQQSAAEAIPAVPQSRARRPASARGSQEAPPDTTVTGTEGTPPSEEDTLTTPQRRTRRRTSAQDSQEAPPDTTVTGTEGTPPSEEDTLATPQRRTRRRTSAQDSQEAPPDTTVTETEGTPASEEATLTTPQTTDQTTSEETVDSTGATPREENGGA